MKINDLLLRLTKEKYLNRWIIFLIDLFLSVFSTVTSLALVSYILDCELLPTKMHSDGFSGVVVL